MLHQPSVVVAFFNNDFEQVIALLYFHFHFMYVTYDSVFNCFKIYSNKEFLYCACDPEKVIKILEKTYDIFLFNRRLQNFIMMKLLVILFKIKLFA